MFVFVNSVLYTNVCMNVTSVKCLLLCCQQLVINAVNTYMQNIYILFYVVIIYWKSVAFLIFVSAFILCFCAYLYGSVIKVYIWCGICVLCVGKSAFYSELLKCILIVVGLLAYVGDVRIALFFCWFRKCSCQFVLFTNVLTL